MERQRVWEIDALRGFLILAVLINHLNATVHAFCINGYYDIDSALWAAISDPLHVWYTYDANGVLQSTKWVLVLRDLCTRPAVDTFFVISGICCMFSRDNMMRGVKILGAGMLVTLFTFLVEGKNDMIRFGVLHCYGCCQIIYDTLLKKRNNWILLAVAAVALALGYYLRYVDISLATPLLYPFGVLESGVSSRDYWPIFPMLGWFLLGVIFGRIFYPVRRSLVPERWKGEGTHWLQFLGRNSGRIYLGHVFVYTAVFMGTGWIFDLF